MRRPTPERYDAAFVWLRANGHDLGALTGQDSHVLLAIDAAWRAYTVSDDAGRAHVFDAIVALFRAMQPKCWPFAVELVARHLDWTDRYRQAEALAAYLPTGLHQYLEIRVP